MPRLFRIIFTSPFGETIHHSEFQFWKILTAGLFSSCSYLMYCFYWGKFSPR